MLAEALAVGPLGMRVEQRQAAGLLIDHLHEGLGLGDLHRVARIALVGFEIQRHQGLRPRPRDGEEGHGLVGPRILPCAEVVSAPQQPRLLGLGAARRIGRIDPVAALGAFMDDTQDAGTANLAEIADRDVVADVDHRIQPFDRGPVGLAGAGRGHVVGRRHGGRTAAASGESGCRHTGQPAQHQPTRDHSGNIPTERSRPPIYHA